MSSLIADARADLVLALREKLVDAPWRVHDYVPDQIVAPCVYIGAATLVSTVVGNPGTRITQANFPVYLVVDGASRAQARQLDDQLALVWDAASTVGDPTEAAPTAIDVGGGNYLSATVVQVDLPLRAITLCPPTLEAVNG